jgi:GT2 family glycosyltransferase
MKNFIIAIITHHREKSVMALLEQLNKQADNQVNCLLVENGSSVIQTKKITQFNNLKIKYLQLKTASIPKARNLSVDYALKNNFKWLVFVDDDCLPTENWLKQIRKLVNKQQKATVIQGNSLSIPQDNLYAQLTEKLHTRWLFKNANQRGNLTIMDTRNCLLKLADFAKHSLKFNEQLTYASDIDLARKLTSRQLTISYQPDLLVLHQEKTSFLDFYRHRLRTSLAYRVVKQKKNNQFHSLSLMDRLSAINELPINTSKKLWLLIVLGIIYLNSGLTLLVQNLKALY